MRWREGLTRMDRVGALFCWLCFTKSYSFLQFRAILLCMRYVLIRPAWACSFQSTCLHSGCPSLSGTDAARCRRRLFNTQFQNCSWRAVYAGKASDHATYAGRVKGKPKQQRL